MERSSRVSSGATGPPLARLATTWRLLWKDPCQRAAIVSSAGVNIGSSSTLYQRSTTDYANLAHRIAQLEARLADARPIGIVARAKRVESLIAIAAACGRQHVPLAILAEDARDLIGELHDWLILDDSLILPDLPAGSLPRSEFETVPPRIVVATSGTSGPPKLVDHSWDSLLAAARLSEQWQGRGWAAAAAFRPGRCQWNVLHY
jgi:acyl-coenzyme A synthetase/AMP-(fatty) acid ligase